MKPGPIVARAWASVRKDDFALVPTLVAFPDVGQVYAPQSEAPFFCVVHEVYPTSVALVGRNRSVVPREHRPALKR